MGGVISQGLLGPMSWLTDRGVTDITSFKEGDDVAELMGVTKFIPLEESDQYDKSSVNTRKDFPHYVPKTDAIRLQHDPDEFLSRIKDREVTITRKEDGCSCTIIYNSGQYMLCGRNYVWNDSDRASNGHYFRIQDQFDLQHVLSLFS